MNPSLKENTILMDKATGELLLINAISPLQGEDVCIIMLEVGEEREQRFAFIKPYAKYSNYEYIGEL